MNQESPLSKFEKKGKKGVILISTKKIDKLHYNTIPNPLYTLNP